ncbi:MAG: serine/threonine protein kinase [Bradymonadaceae bacterium]|nr:serine/threonine protein kinase [Lujinxingiaceae bacterium]
MKRTIVDIPDARETGESDAPDFVRASSVEELAKTMQLGDQAVLNRVLLPGKQFGSYHILGFVAAGGMGEIYAAQRVAADGTRSRPLALKVISSEYSNDWRVIERFKREARISRAISSPHVARVYEYGESPQGHVFLAMDLLTGEELFDRLHRKKVLGATELAGLILQILTGLDHIHTGGYVHRDIKPENIFLARKKNGSELVKILDFGIAKSMEQASDPLLSVAGQIFGTPQYLAPEQASNPDVDARADLYSLGVVMFECVTGSLPFDGETPYAILLAHQNNAVPALPSTVDPEMAEIIYKALAKRPEERFQSAKEMIYVIGRWLDQTSDGEDEVLAPQRSSGLSLADILDDEDLATTSGQHRQLKAEQSQTAYTAQAHPSAEEEELDEEPSAVAQNITIVAIALTIVAAIWVAISALF